MSHHYRVKVYLKMIHRQLQELNDCFNQVRTNLLIGVAYLNPVDSLFDFNINKVLRMTELYPDDFSENMMVTHKS